MNQNIRAFLRDLYQASEESIDNLLTDLSEHKLLSNLVDRLLGARDLFDKSIEGILGAANIATRSEVKQIMEEVDGIRRKVNRLNKNLEDMMAEKTTTPSQAESKSETSPQVAKPASAAMTAKPAPSSVKQVKIATCVTCGKEFVKRSPRQKYCSPGCRPDYKASAQ